MDKIQSYMNKKLSTISSTTSVKEAADTMLKNLIHSLIVVEGDRHIGIVTDEDMTRKLIAPGLDPKETQISFIMETPLITLDESLPMNEALLSMKKNHIRHIVVTGNGEIVGILSIHDFAHYHSRKISDPVSSFWSNSEVLLDEEASCGRLFAALWFIPLSRRSNPRTPVRIARSGTRTQRRSAVWSDRTAADGVSAR